MNKKIIFFIIILLICISTGYIFYKSDLKLQKDKQDYYSHAIITQYIYKIDPNYYDYAIAELNKNKINNYPVNLFEEKLDNNYIFNIGQKLDKIPNNWVVINITKEDLNKSIGFPGCSQLRHQNYPNCFNEPIGYLFSFPIKKENECIEISEIESDTKTSLCLQKKEYTSEDIISKVIFKEFYMCYNLSNKDEANQLINSVELMLKCIKLK